MFAFFSANYPLYSRIIQIIVSIISRFFLKKYGHVVLSLTHPYDLFVFQYYLSSVMYTVLYTIQFSSVSIRSRPFCSANHIISTSISS